MSIYHCAISGEPAEVPVVSKKSGHVFEKRVIEKYIDSTQICPITSQPLSREDLIAVQADSTSKPRPVNATGVADIITIFQSEWDALMLESQVLKQNLETARQELSHTFYQHDAACRVISRLLKERNEAQEQLDQIIGDRGEAQLPEEEEAEEDLPKEVIEQIVRKKTELNAMRKEKKRNPEIINNYASREMLGEYTVANSLTLHSTTKPGITCLDIHPDNDDVLMTGGNDGAVIFYNKAQDKIIKTYEKHHKKITDVKFVSNKNLGANKILSILSCEDGIGNMLVNDLEAGDLTVSYRMNQHKDALVGCTVHPLSYVGVFCARDGTFSFHDLAQAQLLSFVTMEKCQFRNIRIHPDGHIAAIGGQDGVIRVWDILGNRQAVEIKAHNGSVDSLNFSENGVNFATSSFADKTVKLWDLRNLEGDCKIIDNKVGGAINFDQFGQFLAVGSTSLKLYNVKDQEEFMKLDAHKDTITSVQFGAYSKYIATVSLDRHLTIYS